jgi:hypothetical protein
MMEFPAATCPPTRMDQLVHGVDCVRHPIITGCIVSQKGGTPGQQARNYLLCLRDATIHQRAGRAGDLSHAEYLDLLRQLEQWEAAGGKVNLPSPILGYGHRSAPAKPNADNKPDAALQNIQDRVRAAAVAVTAEPSNQTRH